MFNYYYNAPSADSLLQYFEPLNRYLDEAPLVQQKITTTPKPPVRPKVLVKNRKNQKNGDENVKNTKEMPNDQPKSPIESQQTIKIMENSENNSAQSVPQIAMWSGLGIFCLVGVILVGVFLFFKMKKKKRTNNRRFET